MISRQEDFLLIIVPYNPKKVHYHSSTQQDPKSEIPAEENGDNSDKGKNRKKWSEVWNIRKK